MTDLQAKFTHLEDLLTLQHSEELANTDALPVIQAGVDDVNTQIGAMVVDNAAFYDSILSNFQTLAVNMVNGFRDVVAAVNANYCPCDNSGPIIPVPPSTTPTTADGIALCKRIQYFIDLYRTGVLIGESSFVFDAGSLSGQAASILQANALSAVDITTGELSAGMPSSVQVGVSSAWSNYIAAVGAPQAQANVFAVASDVEQWSSIRDALFSADSAATAFPEVATAIAGMEWPDSVKAIVSSGFYSGWYNDIYSDVPIIDDSEYDGSVCGFVPGVCMTLTSVSVTDDHGHSYWAIDQEIDGFEQVYLVGSASGDVTTSLPVTWIGDFDQWTVCVISGSPYFQHRVEGQMSGANFSIDNLDENLYTSIITQVVQIASVVGPFVIRLCPPLKSNICS